MEEAVLDSKEIDEIIEKDELVTHSDIGHNHSYKIIKLKNNYAQIEVSTTKLERLHENRSIYTGSLFFAANFSAVAAINDKEFFLINSDIDFLNPIDEDGIITFYSEMYISTNAKKIVSVSGKLNDIEFFRGIFSFIKFEEKKL